MVIYLRMKINKSKCIGCGNCTSSHPDIFELKDDKAFIKDKTIKGLKEYLDICPVEAIEK